jgi:isoquinoline 1-oxidoreductase beta subunit
MMKADAAVLNRRDFLKTGAAAGAGLVVAFYLPSKGEALSAAGDFQPNAWLAIDPEGQVTIWLAKSEMGQGVHTALPMIVAEELEADWTKVRVEQALAHPNRYGSQGTGGSTSVRTSWTPLRKAGAGAREMLLSAAAATWSVERDACRAENGHIVHAASGRKLSYGSLAERAATLPVPDDPPLKDAKDFRILGRRTRRLDARAKATGKAQYGLDVKVPGMLVAAVARPPALGAKPASFNAAPAKRIAGVREVVEIPSGVAVVAENTWAALQGREALQVRWGPSPHATLSSDAIRKMFAESAARPGAVARNEGDAEQALAGAARKVEQVYEVPYLSHAPMEPPNATAHVTPDSCEIWAPTQVPQAVMNDAAQITGLPVEKIKVHTTMLGGGFGRRLDYEHTTEAVQISKALGAPVKVVWSREDDMQHGPYRPASYHRLSGALDAEGNLIAWRHRIVAPSITGQRWPDRVLDGLDRSAVNGADNLPYGVPNLRVEYVMANTAVPTSWWRSVYNSQNGYVNECFLDELAAAAKKDPYEFRLALLKDKPRHRAVLEMAAEKAGWGRPLPAGRYRGIALHFSFHSYNAQVAEVSVDPEEGTLRVHRVVCVLDCGMALNPLSIEAQMEGSVIYGLSGLRSAITVAKGGVQQRNFDTYPLPRHRDMPKVETYIVPSSEPPTGVGEPGVPVIIPAVLNAVYAATGKRIRRLPLQAEDLMQA